MKFGKKSLSVQFFYIDQNKAFEYCVIFIFNEKERGELSDHFIASNEVSETIEHINFSTI